MAVFIFVLKSCEAFNTSESQKHDLEQNRRWRARRLSNFPGSPTELGWFHTVLLPDHRTRLSATFVLRQSGGHRGGQVYALPWR